jgi:hypothetical protein
MNDIADEGQETSMDAANAAAIMAEAGERARRRLRPDYRVTFTIWGVLWLLGYGITWLVVRGQHPVSGPVPATFAATVLISGLVAAATVEQARDESGVRGRSVALRRIFFASFLLGFAGMFALEGALARAGAGRPVLILFEAAAPILVIGLLYLARSAAGLDWPVAVLGAWMVVVAAAGGYAGPRAVWAIDALAVGLAFLVTAALLTRLRRS